MLATNRAAQAGVPILLVGPGDQVALRAAVGDIARLPDSDVGFADAPAMVRRLRPSLVLVWLDKDLELALRTATELALSDKGLHLVAWSGSSDPAQIRRAMRAGFREHVVLPADRQGLRDAILVAGETPGRTDTTCRYIAIFGSKGGSGATLLALNLGAELARNWKAMLVDMDLSMGDVGIMANVACVSAVSDLLRESHRLDARMLNSAAITHSSGLRILGQPSDAAFEETPDGSTVLDFLRIAGVGFDAMLLDCGSRPEEPGLVALSAADDILLVTHPEVPAVRDAWRCLRILERVGVSRDNVKVVVNRWSGKTGLSLREIEESLGREVFMTLSEDAGTATAAMNEGRLLRDLNPKSALVRDIGNLAARLLPLPDVPTQPVPRRFWPFSRVSP